MSVELPEGWREGRLKDLCESVERRLGTRDQLEILSVAKRGVVPQSQTYDKKIASEDVSRYRVIEPGEFGLAPMALYYGAVGRYRGEAPGIISPAYNVFRHNSNADPDYLETLLRVPRMIARYDALSQGGNLEGKRKLTPYEAFETVKVAIPPLAEQRAIAEVLGAVDEVVAKTEALIEAVLAAKNEVLEDRLRIGAEGENSNQNGWKTCRLRDVATIRTGVSKSKERQFKRPLSVPYLRVANVQDGYLDLEEVKLITIEQDQLSRYSLQKGDVLFNEGGDFDKLGRGCVWADQISPCIHQNHVFAVRCKPILNPEFLALLAASRKGKAYFRLSSKQTTNLASINTSDLRSFPVLLPAMNEQLEIAAISKSFDARAAAEKATLALLVQMRAALVQELLSGRVRLPDNIIARRVDKAGQAA
jgi:type I restriction enzyme S subunit